MKFWIFVLLLLTTSFQVNRTKKLTEKHFSTQGDEFLKSVVLTENKYSKLSISEIYADRIFLVQTLNPAENKLNIEAVRISNPKSPKDYSFELDISNLKKGHYLVVSNADYWVGQMELIIF